MKAQNRPECALCTPPPPSHEFTAAFRGHPCVTKRLFKLPRCCSQQSVYPAVMIFEVTEYRAAPLDDFLSRTHGVSLRLHYSSVPASLPALTRSFGHRLLSVSRTKPSPILELIKDMKVKLLSRKAGGAGKLPACARQKHRRFFTVDTKFFVEISCVFFPTETPCRSFVATEGE